MNSPPPVYTEVIHFFVEDFTNSKKKKRKKIPQWD